MIFFLIIGAMVIRMANSLNYTKTTKLGIMIMLMFTAMIRDEPTNTPPIIAKIPLI